MIDLLPQLALGAIAVILAITLHEAAHGYMALALGDDTAKREGRLSLNPIRHIDRVGTIIVPGILLASQLILAGRIMFMFGWAKPVPVSPWKFRDPRRGMAIVAIAGPAMNFFLAWIGALLVHGSGADITGAAAPMVLQFLSYFMLSNLVLGLFNLLPIPPLDGGRIAVGLLPLQLAIAWARLERAGIVIVLMAVFLLPWATGYDPVGDALHNVLPWAFRTALWLAGHDLGGAGGNVL